MTEVCFFFFFFLLILSGYVSEAAKLGREDLPSCRSYSLEELMEATNNFDNSTFLGENIYGKVVSNFYFLFFLESGSIQI